MNVPLGHGGALGEVGPEPRLERAEEAAGDVLLLDADGGPLALDGCQRLWGTSGWVALGLKTVKVRPCNWLCTMGW